MDAKKTVLQFIAQINAHDVAALCVLMSEQHRFVDALGAVVEGREQMRHGWQGYFGMVPDYYIECGELFEHGPVIAAFGYAGGTYAPDGQLRAENQWRVPAAWRAEIVDGLVAEWRVYADNEPIRQLMAKARQ